MNSQILTRGHNELFRRSPDESFPSLDELWQHCQHQKSQSNDVWERPEVLQPIVVDNRLKLGIRGASAYPSRSACRVLWASIRRSSWNESLR